MIINIIYNNKNIIHANAMPIIWLYYFYASSCIYLIQLPCHFSDTYSEIQSDGMFDCARPIPTPEEMSDVTHGPTRSRLARETLTLLCCH